MKGSLLIDKVCLVTGAARGIGRAICEQLAADGAVVYAADRETAGMEEWTHSCATACDTRVHPLCVDVTDAKGMKDALMAIYKQEKRIDCVVNNAGIVSNKKLGMVLRDDMESMFRVNVFAVIETIQTVARLMARQGGGCIVNIASVTAVHGSAGQVAYSASKGAVIALTKSCAKELAPLNIRVNAVAPGIVKTERFEELYEADGSKIDDRIARIGLGRLATPADVAAACAFLASDRASYISGQILGVDGCAVM